MKFKRFILKNYPSKSFPQDLSCFELVQAEINQLENLQQGKALIKIYYISLEPILRTWISGARSYLDPVQPNSGIPSFGIAKIVKINQPSNASIMYQPGDWVIGMLEWSDYMIIDCSKFQRVPVDLGDEVYKYLSVYGPTGLTSYISIKRQIETFQIWNKKLRRNKSRQQLNIVISSAAGGVGTTVIQYLSRMGYINIYGIAGSDKKCEFVESIGCKKAINYKRYLSKGQFNNNLFERDLKKMMGGEEADIFYDNVGEEMLSSMLNVMANNSKIIVCGALATYNNWNQKSGISNSQNIIFKSIQMKGILYYHQNVFAMFKMFSQMIVLDIKGVEAIVSGIKRLPQTYRELIEGRYIGKPIVKFY